VVSIKGIEIGFDHFMGDDKHVNISIDGKGEIQDIYLPYLANAITHIKQSRMAQK